MKNRFLIHGGLKKRPEFFFLKYRYKQGSQFWPSWWLNLHGFQKIIHSALQINPIHGVRKLCRRVLAQVQHQERRADCEAFSDGLWESVATQLSAFATEYVRTDRVFLASEIIECEAICLSIRGRRADGLARVQTMKRLCHEKECIDGELVCANIRAWLQAAGEPEVEVAAAGLLDLVAFVEENKQRLQKFNVEGFIVTVKVMLSELYLSFGLFKDAIPLLRQAESEDEISKARVHSRLARAFCQAYYSEHEQKDLDECVAYHTSSFRLCKALGATELALGEANCASYVFDLDATRPSYSALFEEAADLAVRVGSCNMTSRFWLHCGNFMSNERKFEEAVKFFVKGLESALQMTGQERELELAAGQLFDFVRWIEWGPTEGSTEGPIGYFSLISSDATRRAFALWSLGRAKFVLKDAADMGCDHMVECIEILNEKQKTPNAGLDKFIYLVQQDLTETYLHCKMIEKAEEIFTSRETKLEKPSEKIEVIVDWVDILIDLRFFHVDQAMEVLNQTLKIFHPLQDTEWYGVALLLARLGKVLGMAHRIPEGIIKLQDACKIWEKEGAFPADELAEAYINIYGMYLGEGRFMEALKFAKRVQPVFERYHCDGDVWIMWKAMLGQGSEHLGDHVLAYEKHLTSALDQAKEMGNDWMVQFGLLIISGFVHLKLKHLSLALDAVEKLEDLLKWRAKLAIDDYQVTLVSWFGAKLDAFKGQVYTSRGSCIDVNESKEFLNKAIEFFDKANECLETFQDSKAYLAIGGILALNEYERLQVNVYAGQAMVLLRRGESGDAPEALKILEKALKVAGQLDRPTIAILKCTQGYGLAVQGALDDAIEVVRDGALLYAEVQLELKDLERAWVSLFGDCMKTLFMFLQELYVDKKDYIKALLWVERGRMRLFQFKVEGIQNGQLLDVAQVPDGGSSSSGAQNCSIEVDTGARQLESQLESVSRHCDQLGSSERASGGNGEGEDVAMDACEDGGFKSDCFGEVILEGMVSHLNLGMDVCGQSLESPLMTGTGLRSPLGAESFELKAHEDCAGTWEELVLPEFTVPAEVDRGTDQLWFDKDDSRAEQLIFQTLAECGEGAAVIEYMYKDETQTLATYFLVGGQSERVIHYHKTYLKDFFLNAENKRMGGTLRALVEKTRTEIKRRQDERALIGLQILHELLFAPVQEHIMDCSKIIFVPHEILHRVPFAALHNKNSFLIEEKNISISPSIRALHRCFDRYKKYEASCEKGTLKPSFVAGNPEPMGLSLRQLEGAAKEAEEVAKLLGVDAVVGGNLTKMVVTEGLSSASSVVLVTHGVVNPTYPHGALVMQGPESASSKQASRCRDASSSATLGVSRMLTLGRGSRQTTSAFASEVLTAEEISALPGGIQAGLVVLSACDTGSGAVTSEGLLGLGRALLEAGASAALLTLWKVDDKITVDLMAGVPHHEHESKLPEFTSDNCELCKTGLFTRLVADGMAVGEALQATMVAMLQDKRYKIFHWAPFFVFGSPFVKLPKLGGTYLSS